MLGALHPRSRESVAELYAAHPGDGENGVRDATLHRIPEGIPHTDSQPGHGAFDYAAQGIPLGGNCLDQGRPFGGILLPANLHQLGIYCDVQLLGSFLGAVFGIQHLLRNHARRHYGKGQAAGEMSAAAGVVREIIFDIGHEVRVPRAGDGGELFVILALHVRIPEHNGDGSAGGIAVQHAAEYLGLVGFAAGSSAHRTGRPAGDVRCEILLFQRNVLRHSVQDHAYGRAVGFAENGNFEILSECVHNVQI